MFQFKRLFQKYNRPFQAITEASEGHYDTETGEYIPPGSPTTVDMQGIITQADDDMLNYGDGGSYTVDDIKVLVDTDSYTLHRGQEILVEGERYTVDQLAPYIIYSHFMKVYAKRVSTDA